MEDFVTFEIAKKLKKKGFREKCMRHYYSKSKDLFLSYAPDCENFGSDIDAPNISQVLVWFRKEKGIYITIFIDDDSDTPVTYEIYKDIECVCTHQGEYFTLKDWNKCELRAIEYTLDNLI